MTKTSHQNRSPKLRRFAALAVIGLSALCGSFPAFGAEVTGSGPLIPGNHGDGLVIVSDGQNSTEVTWDNPNSIIISISDSGVGDTGLVFSDGGNAGGGSTSLTLTGTGAYVIQNGGITNNNHEAVSIIDIQYPSTVLLISNGAIAGNTDQTLEIRNNGGYFIASDSDVTGNVSLLGEGGGSFTLGALGDTGNLTLEGRVDIDSIVGTASIQAQNGAIEADVYMKNGAGNLGDTTHDLNLTLGLDNGLADGSDRVTLHLADIVGSMDGTTSTTLNIDAANAVLASGNPSGNVNISGQVNINLIGAGTAGGLVLGELQQGSTLTVVAECLAADSQSLKLSNGIAGGVTDPDDILNDFTTVIVEDGASLEAAGQSSGNIRVVNENLHDNSQKVTINEIGNTSAGTTLQVGRGNAAGSASSVLVDSIAGGTDLNIASIENPDGSYDYGQVTLDAQNIARNDGGNPADVTTIKLGNAVLQLADDTVDGTHNDMGWAAGAFSMDSTNGESRLIGDQGSNMPGGNMMAFTNAATVEVGAGGDAVIETDGLEYNDALRSADTAAAGAVHFADPANGNKMIFRAFDSANNFNQGVQIADGNWEFEGSTTFTDTNPSNQNTMTGSNISFTGSSSDPDNPSVFTVDVAGDPIDAAGSTLFLNKSVELNYVDGGLGEVDDVVLGGEMEETFLSFDAANATLLRAKNITAGQALTDFSIPTGGREATVAGNVWVGGAAPAAGTAATTGLSADSITLHNRLTVDGVLTLTNSLNGAPVIDIGAELAGFTLTGNSTGSSIEAGTKVTINKNLFDAIGFDRFAAIDILDGAASQDDLIAEMADALEISNIDELNALGFLGTGKVHADGLVLIKLGPGGYPVPDFAQSMADAIDAGGSMGGNNFDQLDNYLELGGAGDEDQFHRELTRIMGNTMNSSLSLAQNGAAQAFSRLNASAGRSDGLWVTPRYIRTSADGKYHEGYGDYTVRSAGVIMGYDKWINENARLGAFLSYGSPKLTNEHQAIEADDFQAGLYARGVLPRGILLDAALSVGRQSYDSTHSVTLPAISHWNQTIKAGYHGRSVGAVFEASRPVTFANNVSMRPAVGYSYQNIRFDGFRENSDNASYNLAQDVSRSSFTMQQARLGTDIGWATPDKSVTLTGKAFFVANLDESRPTGYARFVTAGAQSFAVYGAKQDNAMANLGLSLHYAPAAREGLSLNLEYDALLGSRTRAHALGLTLRYEF